MSQHTTMQAIDKFPGKNNWHACKEYDDDDAVMRYLLRSNYLLHGGRSKSTACTNYVGVHTLYTSGHEIIYGKYGLGGGNLVQIPRR